MVKSPMEYFQAQDFSMDNAGNKDISPTERAFLQKYLGIDDASALQSLPPMEGQAVAGLALSAVRTAALADTAASSPAGAPAAPADAPVVAAPAASVAPPPPAKLPPLPEIIYEPMDEQLKKQEVVTLVGFYVSGDVFVIPIDVVMEVIHYEEPYKLPMAPIFMSGVVNLRGRVLPVISLPELLILEENRQEIPPGKGLIIICEAKGMQVGLKIDRLHTMFKATQDQLNWNADSHLGPSAELLCGLLETGEKLVGIISIDKVVDKILEG